MIDRNGELMRYAVIDTEGRANGVALRDATRLDPPFFLTSDFMEFSDGVDYFNLRAFRTLRDAQNDFAERAGKEIAKCVSRG